MLPFVAYFETLNITIIIAFVPAHVYSLKFGEKITFYHFSKKCLFSVFLHNIIEALQLLLKNAWLPPIFFLDFNSPWYDLLVSHTTVVIIWEKYFPLVGTFLKNGKHMSNKLTSFLMQIL